MKKENEQKSAKQEFRVGDLVLVESSGCLVFQESSSTNGVALNLLPKYSLMEQLS